MEFETYRVQSTSTITSYNITIQSKYTLTYYVLIFVNHIDLNSKVLNLEGIIMSQQETITRLSDVELQL